MHTARLLFRLLRHLSHLSREINFNQFVDSILDIDSFVATMALLSKRFFRNEAVDPRRLIWKYLIVGNLLTRTVKVENRSNMFIFHIVCGGFCGPEEFF